jgi:hypothetical protein
VSLAQIFRSGLICLPGTLQKQTVERSWVQIPAKEIIFLSPAANKAAEQAAKKAGTTAATTAY